MKSGRAIFSVINFYQSFHLFLRPLIFRGRERGAQGLLGLRARARAQVRVSSSAGCQEDVRYAFAYYDGNSGLEVYV